jgi:hypothetical protein
MLRSYPAYSAPGTQHPSRLARILLLLMTFHLACEWPQPGLSNTTSLWVFPAGSTKQRGSRFVFNLTPEDQKLFS